jgi:hypothetical protein
LELAEIIRRSVSREEAPRRQHAALTN